MRKLICAALVVGLVGLTANADIVPGNELALVIYPTGNAEIQNVTGSALAFDSYEIWSAGGNLDPTNGTGWRSIADWVGVDPMGVIAKLGAGGLTFGELTATTSLLAEGNLSGSGTLAASDLFSIGKPLNAGTPTSDLLFYYTKPTVVGDKFIGLVIPEPATLGLLVLGGLALVVRRRRG